MALGRTAYESLGRQQGESSQCYQALGQRCGLSLAAQHPATDTSSPATATPKMDCTNIYFP